MPLLTVARESLWDAIDNWPELKRQPDDVGASIFNQLYRFDDEMPLLDEIAPSLAELPALAIMPTSVTPAWYTNEMQTWPVLFDVVLWTQDWSLPEPEDLMEKVINAIYRATASSPPGNTVPYVKAATGYYPQRLGPISFARSRVGEEQTLKVIVTTAVVTLRTQKDPFQ